MNVTAKITGINYTPFLCEDLLDYNLEDLESALTQKGYFRLNLDNNNKIAISWWVSAKRTRSYPYARVYNTLAYIGRKATIIPIFKDEGKDGDRDYLQWDTISLMSLLGVYVIIAFYSSATKNEKYRNKITNQRFDDDLINSELQNLLSYQSDALHWNLQQIERVGIIGQKAIDAYLKISNDTGVEFHSMVLAQKRIDELKKSKDVFMNLSRQLAEEAAKRESVTLQPKESIRGEKGTITIRNYLGGIYHFTSDEVRIEGKKVYLIEAKHSKSRALPSKDDIKDGLLKMILYTNLEDVRIGKLQLEPIPVLKLTTGNGFNVETLTFKQKILLEKLKEESEVNNFNLVFK